MKKVTVIDIIAWIVMGIFAILILFPLWYVFVISISTPELYANDPWHLFPYEPTLSEYKRVLASSAGIMRSLGITVLISTLGTALSMLLTTSGAYALSKKDLPGQKWIMRFIIFTMFFSGGMVPFYMLVRNLKMNDTILALFIPMAISSYNLIVMKNNFLSIPLSLEEAAKIDGYNDLQILFKIVLPISRPIMAAISLFYFVGFWNDYWMATLFISTNNLYPFQVVLRQMIVQNTVLAEVGVMVQGSNPEQFKMAVMLVGIIPMLVLYPFIQKYFSKGMMLGAVKE